MFFSFLGVSWCLSEIHVLVQSWQTYFTDWHTSKLIMICLPCDWWFAIVHGVGRNKLKPTVQMLQMQNWSSCFLLFFKHVSFVLNKSFTRLYLIKTKTNRYIFVESRPCFILFFCQKRFAEQKRITVFPWPPIL